MHIWKCAHLWRSYLSPNIWMLIITWQVCLAEVKWAFYAPTVSYTIPLPRKYEVNILHDTKQGLCILGSSYPHFPYCNWLSWKHQLIWSMHKVVYKHINSILMTWAIINNQINNFIMITLFGAILLKPWLNLCIILHCSYILFLLIRLYILVIVGSDLGYS